jgi:iron complex outermembrane receptor protein
MLLAIMRKAAMLLLAVIGFTAFAKAQTVTGTVTDAKGDPIAGISVTVKGTTKGTSTNAQGVFTLTGVANGATLVFSGSSYTAKEVKVTGGTVNVSLATNVTNLNDIVVVSIGYGGVRNKDLTGAVGSLTSKNFNQGAISAPDQLLQSKIAGVLVTTNSGEPGAGSTVTIRGNNSLRANNNPLYVIDGVPIDGRNAEPGLNVDGFGASPSSNPLLFVNPNDIATITILKDASSAAIYGSRGANGVVVITTKKGTSGAMKLDAGVSYGAFAGYMKKFEVLSKSEFVSALAKYGAPSTLNGGQSVDPLKEITNKAITQNYTLAISGGNENGKYRASFLATNAEGFIKNTGLNKYVGSFSGSLYGLDKKLTIDFNLTAGNVGHTFTAIGNTAGSQGDIITSALQWNPTTNFKDANGFFVFPTNGTGNPMAFLDGVHDKAVTNTILANISAAYKILPNLEYKFLYAINHGTGVRNASYDGWLQGYNPISGAGFGVIANQALNSQTFTHTLNYTAKLAKELNLTALAGYEFWRSEFSYNTFTALGFNTNLTQATRSPILYTSIMQNANVQRLPTTYLDPITDLQSYFARAILNWKDKYLVTGTVRRDGSSKFGANNKYGTFPSLAGKWVVSNEDFLKTNRIVSTLAARISWGINGNQEFPAGSSIDQIATNAYQTFGQVTAANPDLKWEQTTSTNFGIDFGFLKGRIFGSLDIYKKNTTNLLYSTPAIQPAPNGAITFRNLSANLINKGFELQLGGAIIQKADLAWDLSFNVSNNDNKLTNFNQALQNTGSISGQGLSGAFSEAIANNQPLQVFYLKHFSGFDANGVQIVTDNPAFAGDPNPHTTYGVSTTVRYKKFELTINAGGAGGFLIYNNTANGVTNIAGISNGRNIDKATYNSPASAKDAVSASDRWLEKGNFFKLRNTRVLYTVGNVGKYVKNLSAYISGNNLFVITKFTGFDPEVNIDKSNNGYPSRSIEYAPYPTARTITLGLNFSL